MGSNERLTATTKEAVLVYFLGVSVGGSFSHPLFYFAAVVFAAWFVISVNRRRAAQRLGVKMEEGK